MKCPKCGIELVCIMTEVIATWYRCEQCGGEIIRPDPNGEHRHQFYSL